MGTPKPALTKPALRGLIMALTLAAVWLSVMLVPPGPAATLLVGIMIGLGLGACVAL